MRIFAKKWYQPILRNILILVSYGFYVIRWNKNLPLVGPWAIILSYGLYYVAQSWSKPLVSSKDLTDLKKFNHSKTEWIFKLLISFQYVFLFLIMCMHVCGSVHMTAGPCGGQMSNPPELELQVVTMCFTWCYLSSPHPDVMFLPLSIYKRTLDFSILI